MGVRHACGAADCSCGRKSASSPSRATSTRNARWEGSVFVPPPSGPSTDHRCPGSHIVTDPTAIRGGPRGTQEAPRGPRGRGNAWIGRQDAHVRAVVVLDVREPLESCCHGRLDHTTTPALNDIHLCTGINLAPRAHDVLVLAGPGPQEVLVTSATHARFHRISFGPFRLPAAV